MSVLATRPTMGFLQSVFVAVVLTGCFVLWRYRSGPRGAPMLPGPRALPFIGCVHLLPAESAERKFREWGQTYGEHVLVSARTQADDDHRDTCCYEGPLISVPLFSKSVVVVNTVDAARDLMDKRSANYSDRPDPNLLEE